MIESPNLKPTNPPIHNFEENPQNIPPPNPQYLFPLAPTFLGVIVLLIFISVLISFKNIISELEHINETNSKILIQLSKVDKMNETLQEMQQNKQIFEPLEPLQ